MEITVNGKVVTIKCETEDEAKGIAWGISRANDLIVEGRQFLKIRKNTLKTL